MPRWAVAAGAIAALVAAAAIGWRLGQPEPVVETAAPAQQHPDGSVTLERKPDAAAKPVHPVPKQSTVERVGRVTVQPAAAIDAPPVNVDWSLVREQDGGKRVIASSPDGVIVGGVDIPIETAAPLPPQKRWAAGLSWSPQHETYGAWIERDVPVFAATARVGVDINQTRIDRESGIEARVRIGFAF